MSGHLAYRGMVAANELPDVMRAPVVTAWLGPRLHVVHYPVRRGEWFNVVAVVEGLLGRVRHRVSDSSCGLCGVENLEQAMRPLPAVTARSEASREAIFGALRDLAAHQPLNRQTGAVHVAALAGPDGAIRLAYEDVGRHNAFDKLIGAMRRGQMSWDGGFALLSSRCSFELVEKAALANCPLLVTISAPTRLAAERAASAGLPIIVLARPDAVLAVCDLPD